MENNLLSLCEKGVSNLEDAKAFIKECVKVYDLGFHIDNSFTDYDGKLFTKKECKQLDKHLEKCMDVCDIEDVDIYEIAMDEITEYCNAHGIVL
jgi:hypothetical protein